MSPAYRERFLRSMGILTEEHLAKIKETTIGVAGLGLGGSIFVNLVRMGFEKFHLADPDTFERTNINRQRLARETSIGRRKDEMAVEEARSINPDVMIRTFTEGVKAANIDQFLDGLNWVIDVIDVFALPDKLALHEAARNKGIPVISCATLGFSGSMIVFESSTPSFAELTGMRAEEADIDNLQRFLRFMAPEIPSYLQQQLFAAMDRSTHIPFVVPGGELCAAFSTTEIAKAIMGSGDRVRAPMGLFVDAYANRIERFRADFRWRGLPLSPGLAA